MRGLHWRLCRWPPELRRLPHVWRLRKHWRHRRRFLRRVVGRRRLPPSTGLLRRRRHTVRTCVLTLISGAVRTRQHLSQELLVHCVNTCLRRCWYTVSTPVLAFEHPCLASKSGWHAWLYVQHVAKAAFTQSPNSCKKRHFLCCKSFFEFPPYFFCFGPLRGTPVDPRSVPTPFQHCVNTRERDRQPVSE